MHWVNKQWITEYCQTYVFVVSKASFFHCRQKERGFMTENFAQAAEFKNLRLSFLAKMWANKTLSLITCPHRHSIAFQMQCRLPQLLFSVIF